MLTNLNGEDYESIDEYLRAIKSTVDSLAAVQSPVSDLELIQLTTDGWLLIMTPLSILFPF